jgi:spore coat protein A
MVSRRGFLKVSGAVGAGALLASNYRFVQRALAATQGPGLSDPAMQPKFANLVPNALDPGFIYKPKKGMIDVGVAPTTQMTGLVDPSGVPVPTPLWGYGDASDDIYTWPGRTFEVKSGEPLAVTWENKLVGPGKTPLPFLITGKDNTSAGFDDYTGLSVVDTSLHWAYSLPGYDSYSIDVNGVPIVAHVHGGHTDYQFDGNPEFFFSPQWAIMGPQWVAKQYLYDNSQPAGTIWYHDHALGITRLNVYAGMAGFYIIRDDFDTGKKNNPLDLPVFPYEAAFAIQDRMFKDNGELFYPAFPGDPYYEDFITGEGATLPFDGPTGLAEFFGDHMVVNGVIWPKMDVEPRNYRLRFLNGCDSRFLAIQLFEVPAGATDFSTVVQQLNFTVIGSDQGLASSPTPVDTLLIETGSRYDLLVDFKNVTPGNRVIVKNIGGDEPFGGDIPGPQVFGETDRIMAFDVVLRYKGGPDVTPMGINFGPNVPAGYDRLRKVALFEGKDEFGRLQPLLGTAEPATDYAGVAIDWPATPVYEQAKLPDGTDSPLIGPMEGSIAWHSPTTENPDLYTTEEWEVWNMTGDAHPVHLHLVHFEVLGREEVVWDSNTVEVGDLLLDGTIATEDDETRVIPNAKALAPANDGTYLVVQPTVQHNSVAGDETTYGQGFKIVNPTKTGVDLPQPAEYVENAPKDMVTALPDQVTRIKAHFDKPGRYVWHCHILSHEDHEMMRVMYVGPGA